MALIDFSLRRILNKLPPMRELRVNTAGLQAMASRWSASVGELNATVAPADLGLSCQASAAAVNAAHADIMAFAGALAARVSTRATHVAEADTRYIANEAGSASDYSTNELASVAPRVIGV